MKGKYNLFVSAFLAFFASVLVVNAKDLTLTQLGEAIKEADPDATEAFVIGTHVFTDTHLLTTQDVMIAARTINVGDINEKGYGFNESKPEADPLYKLMAINVIEMSGNTWKVGSPVIAGPALADKINVEYINYKYVSVKVNTDEIVKAEVEKINETAKNAILTMSNDVVTVKTKASLNTTVASTIAEDLLNLMKSETYAGKFASIKLATVDSNGKVSTTDVLEIKTNTTKSEISSKLSTYISGNSNFVVEFTMAEGIANTGNYETYTVKFVTLVDTDAAFTSNVTGATVASSQDWVVSCDKVEGANCNLVLNVKKGTNHTLVDVTEVANALKSLLQKTGKVESIVVEMSDRKTLTSADANTVGTALATLTSSKKLSELLNNKITITIKLVEGAALSQNDKTVETYTLNIIGNINTDDNVKEAANTANSVLGNGSAKGFVLDYTEKTNEVIIRIVDGSKKFQANAMGTGLGQAILAMIQTGLYKSVTINGTKVDISAGDAAAYGTFAEKLEEVMSSMTDGESLTSGIELSKLQGLSLSFVLEYKDGVTNTGHDVYTVRFLGEVDTDRDTNSLLAGLNSGKALADTDVTVPAKSTKVVFGLDTTKLGLTSSKPNVDEFASALRRIVKLYDSIEVTYNGVKYVVKYTQAEGLEIDNYGDLNNLVTALSGKKTEEVLKGQTITIKYNLIDDTTNKAKNGETYTVKFTIEADLRTTIETYLGEIESSNVSIIKSKNKNISEDDVITFDVVSPFAILKDMNVGLASELLELFETNFVKSITFYYNNTPYVMTYVPVDTASHVETARVDGVDELIKAMGGNSAQLVNVAKNINSLKVEIVLADGVSDYVLNGGVKEYTDKTVLTYDIVLSTKISAKDTLKTFFDTPGNHASTNKFNVKVNNGKVQVLYDSALGASDLYAKLFFEDNTMVQALITLLTTETRIESIVFNIGNSPVRIEKTSAAASIVNEIKAKIGELVNSSNPEFTYGNTTSMADLVSHLGSNKISLTINLAEGSATLTENGTATITYEFEFSMSHAVTGTTNLTGFGVNGVSTWAGNKLTTEVDSTSKDTSISLDFFTASSTTDGLGELLTKLFDNSNYISSITVLGETITAGDYADAKTSEQVTRLTKRLNASIVSYLKSLGVNVENADTTPKAKLGELIGKEITFTINMASGVLSENGNSSETFTVDFVEKK